MTHSRTNAPNADGNSVCMRSYPFRITLSGSITENLEASNLFLQFSDKNPKRPGYDYGTYLRAVLSRTVFIEFNCPISLSACSGLHR